MKQCTPFVFGKKKVRLSLLAIAGIVAGLLGFSDHDASAITGCTAATNILSTDDLEATQEAIECTTSPCNPGKCTYDGTTFTNCGKLTQCVLNGEDPPITNGAWDEPLQGFQGLGSTMMTGRCQPPLSPNYYLYCPALGYAPDTGSGNFTSGSFGSGDR